MENNDELIAHLRRCAASGVGRSLTDRDLMTRAASVIEDLEKDLLEVVAQRDRLRRRVDDLSVMAEVHGDV